MSAFPHQGVVYFAACGQYVKIGYSRSGQGYPIPRAGALHRPRGTGLPVRGEPGREPHHNREAGAPATSPDVTGAHEHKEYPMRTHLDVFPEAHDIPSGYMQGSGAAVLRIGRLALYLDRPEVDPAAWLRSLSAACDDLAEQVELANRPGLALAEQHIAEDKAAAGIGGAS